MPDARKPEATQRPPPHPRPTPRHRTSTLGDLSFSRWADAATGKKTARHGGKNVQPPKPTTPKPPDDAERLGCHRGIFHHRGSGYTSRLGGFEGNTTLLRAKGTRHVGKKYATTPAGHAEAARRPRSHGRLGKKYLAQDLAEKTWVLCRN